MPEMSLAVDMDRLEARRELPPETCRGTGGRRLMAAWLDTVFGIGRDEGQGVRDDD